MSKTDKDTDKAILKVLDDAFEMGRGLYPEDYTNLRGGMLKEIKQLLAQRNVILPEKKAMTKSTDYNTSTAPIELTYAYRDGWNACIDATAKLNPNFKEENDE